MRTPFGRRAIAATSLAAAAMTLIAPLALTPTAQAAPRTSDVISKQLALRARDLSAGQTLQWDSGQSPLVPAADGQYCDITDNGATGLEPQPINGRIWLYYDANEQASTDESVTVWADGPGALADVQADTGYCRFFDDMTVTLADDDEFAGNDGFQYVHSILVRNTLVSVTVSDWAGVIDDEAAEAQRLAELAAAKVERSRLP